MVDFLVVIVKVISGNCLVYLLGYLMGGKVVMWMVFDNFDLVCSFIVVDMVLVDLCFICLVFFVDVMKLVNLIVLIIC